MNEQDLMKTDEATGIMYRQWLAPETKAVFLLVHGLGAQTARWGFLAGFLLKEGISSYALELKSFGETKGLKGHVESFNVYSDDIYSLRDIMARAHPGKKIYLLGESLGALISILTVAGKNGEFSGLICLSPAFKSKLKVSLLERFKMICALLVNPKKHFRIPFDSSMCTRDEAYRRAMNGDKREHRLATARFIFNMVTAQFRVYLINGKLKIPMLILLAGNDKITDTEAAKRMFKTMKNKDKTLIEYPGMYHSLSVELGRERVFEDIHKWVRERV